MKAILMSIKPKYVAKILNGEKTVEIRKRFPKDYVGWVYIYHTKAKNSNEWLIPTAAKWTKENDCSGKVVARFWCDKVEEIACVSNGIGTCAYLFANTYNDIRKASCLNTQDLISYLGAKLNGEIVGKAIHITKLEIFDKPKELSEFETTKQQCVDIGQIQQIFQNIPLTKAPQSWQYIEVEE